MEGRGEGDGLVEFGSEVVEGARAPEGAVDEEKEDEEGFKCRVIFDFFGSRGFESVSNRASEN